MLSYDQFKTVLPDASARQSLGIQLDDARARDLLANEAQAIAFYETWIREKPDTERWSGLAIAGFILSIVGVILTANPNSTGVATTTVVLALIFSHIGAVTKKRGVVLAVFGLAIGYLGLLVCIYQFWHNSSI